MPAHAVLRYVQGVSVRVRRPSDYNPSMAATLGPSQPSALLNLAAVGLTPGFGGSYATHPPIPSPPPHPLSSLFLSLFLPKNRRT